MKFDDIQSSIKEKLGDENTGLIADDLANLITLNSKQENNIKDLNSEISKLKKDKETLIQANGNLLQQIDASKESILNPDDADKNEYTPFDFRSVYDEKGNFKKKL